MSVGHSVQRSCQVTHGKTQYEVELCFRDGDRLTIHVYPDQRVTAFAPSDQPLDRVLGRIQARAGWIAAKVRHFEQFKPLPVPRRFVSGETLLYLGRQYRLRVRAAERDYARMNGQFLCVDVVDSSDTARTKKLVQAWFRHRAEIVLTERVLRNTERTKSLRLPAPKMRLRRMATRWGSCTAAGTILLHPDLIMVPSQCIDYVITHELCHRKVLGHDRRFYALLDRYLPDWRRRKARLEQFVIPDYD
jgi:hypothetical protein